MGHGLTSGIRESLGLSSSVPSVRLLWVGPVVKHGECPTAMVQCVKMSYIAQFWPLYVVHKGHVSLSLTHGF